MSIQPVAYLRASTDSANSLRVFVRDEAGRVDLTGKALAVTLRRFGTSTTLATLPATGNALGAVSFDVGADTIRRTLFPGAYAYRVTADGVEVSAGQLEVVP